MKISYIHFIICEQTFIIYKLKYKYLIYLFIYLCIIVQVNFIGLPVNITQSFGLNFVHVSP